jgi:hypothetical protein
MPMQTSVTSKLHWVCICCILTQPNHLARGLLGGHCPVLHAAADADNLGGYGCVVCGILLWQGTPGSLEHMLAPLLLLLLYTL